jgi:hypothetical protein
VTLLAPPPSAGVLTPARRPRRRPLLLGALPAVLGLLWSAGLLLAPGSVALSAGSTSFGGAAPVTTVPGFGLRGTHVVGYAHGADLEVRVPVRNDGPLPVTVTSAATGAGVLPLLEVRSVEGLPLRLGPGQTGELVLRAVLGNCAYYHEREAQNVDALRLDVQPGVPLAGVVRSVVPLDRPLLARSPMIVRCPDRKLDRQAADRSDGL